LPSESSSRRVGYHQKTQKAIQGDDWLPRGELPIQPEKLTTKWKGASIMFVTVPTGSVEPASDIS